jgi:hypothetical protein
MYVPHQKQESSPLKKFAQASLEKPGMYLIALRSHIGRGKTMIGQVLHSVADTLPQTDKLPEPDARIITH